MGYLIKEDTDVLTAVKMSAMIFHCMFFIAVVESNKLEVRDACVRNA